MNKVYLKIPIIDELHYRQEWMQDSKTMSYNAGFDLNLKRSKRIIRNWEKKSNKW